MKVIGITGGIGSGKSAILSYIAKKYNCKVILADEVAHQVMEPGTSCYHSLIALLSKEIVTADGQIDRREMAKHIFASKELLRQTNEIIHPAVKEEITNEIKAEKEKKQLDYLFIEAALLIEDGYMNIVDEMWYIYADEAQRKNRLKESRGYSDEKIASIMKTQLTEEAFRKQCKVVIDNNKGLEESYRQIDKELGAHQ